MNTIKRASTPIAAAAATLLMMATVVTTAAGCSANASEGESPPGSPPAPVATPTEDPSGTSATTIELGDVRPDNEVRFDVPRGALGFNVTVVGDPMWNVGIESLTSPSGSLAVTNFYPDGSEAAVALGSRGLGSISVPQTDATATRPLETGSWRLKVGGIVIDPNSRPDKSGKTLPTGAPVTGPLRVTISIQRSHDGEFHGGVLDMHVYIPAGLRVHDPGVVHEITADSAKDDASVQRRLDLFYEDLQRLFGIGRGAVAFHPIDPSFLSATTGEARASLMAQANVRAPQALHVVLTNRLSYSEGSPLLGYSVGMPGAPNTASSVRSSIAVALYDDQPASNDAVTILHEMGHFVGLMHSTEEDGTTDLLADTPVCNLDIKGRPCADEDNLMAPLGPLHAATVSPSQIRVMRGSPIYRATAK